MTKVLGRFANSPAACTFSISLGVGVMLSVAYLDPSQTSAIALRHAVGAIFLLAPSVAQRWRDNEY